MSYFKRRFVPGFAIALVAVGLYMALTTNSADAHGGHAFRVLPSTIQSNGSCEATGLYTASADGACTHGPDPAPPGVTPAEEDLPEQFTEASFAVCDGNGTSGDRVQVIYARASDRPDRYDEYVDSFRQWASEGDQVYQASAAQTGGMRYIRFVHDADCVISVARATLTTTGDDDFWQMSGDLWNLGFHDPSRKYLVFIDRNDDDFCGQADVYHDDSHGQGNANNTTYGFAAIYNGCWNSNLTISHELGHNFGAVQGSSPNASKWDHCTDEWDVMCYDDGSGPGYPIQIKCPDESQNYILDCNKDDYFNTNPKAGTYLATHWNIANSAWLGATDASILLDKDQSKYNGWIAATLSGFTPGKKITLYWPDLTVIGSVTASGSGTGIVKFRTPLVELGTYTILAKDTSAMADTVLLRVIPRINATAFSGYPGTVLRIYLYGFAADDKVALNWVTDDQSLDTLATVTIAENGWGSSLITIPYTVEVGDHTIRGSVVGEGRSASLTYELTQTPWTVGLDKTSSKYNGAVTATVAGFTANSPLTLTWPDGTILGQTTTTGSGGGTIPFTTPLAALGDYNLLATDGDGHVGVALLRVIPRVLLSDDSGYPRATIRVYYYGFGPGDQVETRWYALDGDSYQVLGTATIADNGRGSVLIPIPESDEYGNHTIRGNVIGESRSSSATFNLLTPPWHLSLNKTSSKYNGAVVATATGFAANASITLSWSDGSILGSGMTDGSGAAMVTFRTPLSPLGDYRVRATDSSGNTITAPLRVIPRIKLNEDSGERRSEVRVYFYGFAPGDQVEIKWYSGADGGPFDVLGTLTIADNGRGSMVVTIPEDASFGSHTIRGDVIGASRSTSTTFKVTDPGDAEDGTATPTPIPTATATATETPTPGPVLTETPTPIATETPVIEATPTDAPTETPTVEATSVPTETEAAVPTESPTEAPTDTPTTVPTDEPTPTPTPGDLGSVPVYRRELS